jgi:hypothetical protein
MLVLFVTPSNSAINNAAEVEAGASNNRENIIRNTSGRIKAMG